MAYYDYSPYDPWGDGGADSGGGYTPPQDPPYADPPPPDLTGQGGTPPPGGDNRPPKPPDPGDGRVWIWMGDQWGLTEPTSAPFGPHQNTTTIGSLAAPTHQTTLEPLNYPQFNAPTFTAPAPFSYADFQAPTLQQAQNEPGFQFALEQGLKAMENSKAYQGTYRSGGTIKGLNDYARNAANQNYNDVFRRSGETYDRNRSNAADIYSTNYGVSRDVFDRNYQAAKDTYAPQARAAELNFSRNWDQYAYEGDDAYRRWKAQIDAAAQIANG